MPPLPHPSSTSSQPRRPQHRALPRSVWIYLTAATVALSLLGLRGAFSDYASRMAPVLGFVAAMAVVVDCAESAGVLRSVVATLRRLSRWTTRPVFAWLTIALLATLCTVFFSLDTTAIVLTPLALLIGRDVGFRPEYIVVSIIWIANLASSVLVVSNLTTLLAERTGLISSSDLLLPGLTLAAVGVAASTVILASRQSSTRPLDDAPAPHPRRLWSGGILLALMVSLTVVTPVWVPATFAAVLLWILSTQRSASRLLQEVIPWNALALVIAATSWATLAFHLGVLDWLITALKGHSSWILMLVASFGANMVNNLPAYLVMEPAAHSTTDLVGVLIGVNAGCLLTPWASLATLLTLEQARLRGVRLRWRRVVVPSIGILVIALGTTGLLFLL